MDTCEQETDTGTVTAGKVQSLVAAGSGMRFYGGTCFISRRYHADINLSCAVNGAGTREKMNVQNEMQNMFRREAVKAFHERTAPVRKRWESYLEEHPTEPVVFDWKSLLGTPPLQKPPQIFTKAVSVNLC